MRTATAAELHRRTADVLRAVQAGQTVTIVHYRRQIARVVPAAARPPVTAERAESIFRLSPLPDDSWGQELADLRAEGWADPWDRR